VCCGGIWWQKQRSLGKNGPPVTIDQRLMGWRNDALIVDGVTVDNNRVGRHLNRRSGRTIGIIVSDPQADGKFQNRWIME